MSGAVHTTADTVRPALQLIRTLPSSPIVSSVFFMCLPDQVLVYGDCAINTDPSAHQLATIAMDSADTAAAFGITPRVALLSYATGDSNKGEWRGSTPRCRHMRGGKRRWLLWDSGGCAGPIIQKVIDAVAIAKAKRPDLHIEGPLQYDAAVNLETAKTKMKGRESAVAGKATVLIFPDLNTGNTTYKAVQQVGLPNRVHGEYREDGPCVIPYEKIANLVDAIFTFVVFTRLQSTGAIAMGPVLQGLRKPVNDLSRGCTVADIVTTIAITAIQAHTLSNENNSQE